MSGLLKDEDELEKSYPPQSNDTYHGDYISYESLPDEFDAREAWPDCKSIGLIRNQGQCLSCWAVSVASVISDRVSSFPTNFNYFCGNS